MRNTFQIDQAVIRTVGDKSTIGSTGTVVELDVAAGRVRVLWDKGQWADPIRTWIKATSLKAA